MLGCLLGELRETGRHKILGVGSKRVRAARRWAFDVPGDAWIINDSLWTLKEMDSFRTDRKQFIERMDGECGATASRIYDRQDSNVPGNAEHQVSSLTLRRLQCWQAAREPTSRRPRRELQTDVMEREWKQYHRSKVGSG
jgi:hypothetical protein